MRCPIGLMDKASASGAEDCRFESCIGRFCTISHLMFQGHTLLPDTTPLFQTCSGWSIWILGSLHSYAYELSTQHQDAITCSAT